MSLIGSLSILDRVFDSSLFSNDVSGFNYRIDSKINETDDSYNIDFIVPGYNKEEISVSIEGKNLIVVADKSNNGGVYKYNKSIFLPNKVENITAKLENGILTVTVPKQKIKKEKIIVDIK